MDKKSPLKEIAAPDREKILDDFIRNSPLIEDPEDERAKVRAFIAMRLNEADPDSSIQEVMEEAAREYYMIATTPPVPIHLIVIIIVIVAILIWTFF
jgi:hypothetical protein